MTNTDRIISTLLKTKDDYVASQSWIQLAKFAFIDYLASYSLGLSNKKTQKLIKSLEIPSEKANLLYLNVTSTIERIAFLNGYLAHYEDLDDVHASFRGHPSAVIFSALLAVRDSKVTVDDFLWAYLTGLEFVCRLGLQLQPSHVNSGWHATATLASLGAAAAIGNLKQVDVKKFRYLLSYAASQASGFLFQEGTDGKPANAGFAARNAVIAYQLTQEGLTAFDDVFGNQEKGWAQTVRGRALNSDRLLKEWMQPAQIESPGLWFKKYSFCSAGAASFDAACLAYLDNVKIDEIEEMFVHFSENGDRALTYSNPRTKLEGKFSSEYLIWLGLSKGKVDNTTDFSDEKINPDFYQFSQKIKRLRDISCDSDQRPTHLDIKIQDGWKTYKVDNPKGSPGNPLSETELMEKFILATGNRTVLDYLNGKTTELDELLNILEGAI